MSKIMSGKEVGERALNEFLNKKHELADPSPWLTLFLDQSIPMDAKAKAAYLKNCESWSRQFLLPIIRPFCFCTIALFQVLKVFIPNALKFSKFLHYLIYLGQKYVVSPEANLIIMRHFHLGSQTLKFIEKNVPGFVSPTQPIQPTQLNDIYKGEIYLNHDLNLFNFIIALNLHLNANKTSLQKPEKLDFSMISDEDFKIEGLRDSWLNFLDAESAIEIFTPLYQLLLTDKDFWRAYHSLQLDETIGIYIATLLGNTSMIGLVNNRHPLTPLSGLRAGFRLVLHGISSELCHGILNTVKRAHIHGTPLPLIQR